MLYLEYILFAVAIISFIGHYIMRELYAFYLYNTIAIVFGYLSLNSVYEITHKRNLYNIYLFIMNDETVA
jgi:hypothetical protein